MANACIVSPREVSNASRGKKRWRSIIQSAKKVAGADEIAAGRPPLLKRQSSSDTMMLDTSSASTQRDDVSVTVPLSTTTATPDPLLDKTVLRPISSLTESCSTVESVRASTGCMRVRTLAQSLSSSTGSTPSNHLDANKRSVAWSTVEFQTYDVILGDNPSTSRGPPLSISDVVVDKQRLSLTEYEEFRPPRRSMSDLIVPVSIRERVLMDAGYARSDLQVMEEKLMRIKMSRRYNARESIIEKAVLAFQKKKNQRILTANRLMAASSDPRA